MDWTPENMKWFFELSPPRTVDDGMLTKALDVIFPKIVRVIFYLLPALMLLTTGMMMTILIKTADMRGEWRLLKGPTTFTSGKVLDVEANKSSKGSITYIYDFEFKPVGGKMDAPPVKGVCFSGDPVASAGQSVQIEYIPDDPKISRIEGCNLNPMPWALFAAMPFIGIFSAVIPLGLLRYKRNWLLRLLTFGKLTEAVIEKVKPGPKGSIIVEVRYNVDGVELKSKTNINGQKGEKDWLKSLHESARPVTLLVDPRKPKSIFLLDLLLQRESKRISG